MGILRATLSPKLRVTAWHGLELCGLAPYLACCIGAEDCTRYKPEAEPVLRGAEELGLDPAECWYIGDSPYDIQAGKAAGCKTIAVTWGVFTEEALIEERPDQVCHTFAEVVGVCT